MKLQTVVFIGKSGCGKGTQADLLIEEIKRRDAEHPTLYVETGDKFRTFLKEASHSATLARDIYDMGGLQPEFLAIHMWSHAFIESLSGNEHLIIDGTPRKLHEAHVLDSAFKFYRRETPTIVHIDVSDDWSKARMSERKRTDDDPEEVRKRLTWFETDVKPAVEWYRTAPGYRFIEVNGERTIDEIHQDLVKAILD